MMIEEPLEKIADYVAAGADVITFHQEASTHVHRVLQKMGTLTNANDPQRGLVRGIALNLGTPLSALEPVLEDIDLVPLLAVNPGWGGQKLIAATFGRIAKAQRIIADSGREILLAVDGGITREGLRGWRSRRGGRPQPGTSPRGAPSSRKTEPVQFPLPILRRNSMIARSCQSWSKSFFALILFLGFVALGFGAEPTRKINVVFLVLDQVQADRLHCYGNPRETSPNIDRLAQRGILFSHFFTVGSWTSPSFASLHTSLFPSRHGITLEALGLVVPGLRNMSLINLDTPMMVPTFKDHGYYTTAFVNNGFAGEELTGRGFDEYYQAQRSSQLINIVERAEEENVSTEIERLTGIRTTRQALAWLDLHKSENFFLYVHFFEPHSPYNPPPEDDIFRSDAYPYLFDRGYDTARAPAKRLAMLGDQKAIERLYQLYDGKIHFVDRYVGKILDHLQALGLEKNTLVVLTSDHGELMFSHPRDYQTADHISLYDTNLHIPLIIAGPGIPKGHVVDGLASNVDTAPTVLDLVGLPPLPGAQGQSLVPLIQGAKESLNPYIYMEDDLQPPGRAVRSLHYKLIRNLWTGKEMLFNEDGDPREQRDIIQQEPRVAKDLRTHLDEYMKQNEPTKDVQLRRFRLFTENDFEVIVENQTIDSRFMINGESWHSDTEPRSGNYNVGCFWTEPGDGSRTAVWRNDIPMLGTYEVSVYFGQPSVGRLATNAPFEVVTDEDSKTVHIDFSKGAGEWHALGTFHNPRYVSVSNAADGVIVADTVKFERINSE